MVYLVADMMTNYLGLYRKGSMQDANSWPYLVYPQLVKKKLLLQSVEYRVINDDFIFTIIKFIKDDYAKRISIEAAT